MTSLRQIEANRRNALNSTGPQTEDGKERSRLNAVRHGLTAETVIRHLEDADDYQAFEESVCASYAPFTAVERELVLRLASVLWRLRRANLIETELFSSEASDGEGRGALISADAHPLAAIFVALTNQSNKPIEKLTRYESALWRQAKQLMAQLNGSGGRRNYRRSLL